MSTIFITGPARSGTTILSKYLASHQHCELAYEPPFLFFLFAEFQLGYITESSFLRLYSHYAFDDFLLESLSGRRINTSIHDDSSVYIYKSSDEIKLRLSRSIRRDRSLLDIASNSNLILKMPDQSWLLKFFADRHPSQINISTIRHPVHNAFSLLSKSWFSDEGLLSGRVYPLRDNESALPVPLWAAKYSDLFRKSSHEQRIILYLYESLKAIESSPSHRVVYDDFVSSPSYRDSLSSILDLKLTVMTQQVNDSIYSSLVPTDLIDLFSSSPYFLPTLQLYESLREQSLQQTT